MTSAGRALAAAGACWLSCAIASPARADAEPEPAAAAEAAGYKGARVIARRALAVVEARKGGRRWLLAVRGAEVVELDDASGGGRASETRATVKPFFGLDELLDVTVTAAWSNGMGGWSRETHYLVRAGAALELACRFEGSSSRGMEERNQSTTVSLQRIKRAPLTFELVERQSGYSHFGEPDDKPGHNEPNIVRYVVPEHGRCVRKDGYGIPGR